MLALANAGIMLFLYGGLGFIGLKLSQKLGFPEIWDTKVSNKQRFLIPALIGAVLGIFLIIADTIFTRFHTLGPIPHPLFPSSIIASISAGIGEELIFRLFFISFWVWLISYVILKKRWQNQIFWVVAVISALAFALGHLPAVLILSNLKTVSQIPPALMAEIILLNGVVSLFAAYYFRVFGFLAPVGIHFWTDIVWHVIWGLI
ncbi:MAG: CPBP family glutamic-type intramembrane protease [Chloroflexota bacterium]